MDQNVAKLMNMNVGQRFDELNMMSKFNDPKVILALSHEWEFQTKISTILALKIRADAHLRRGSIGFATENLIQIAYLSDGMYETTERIGHGLRISNSNEHPDLNTSKIEIPQWYFESLTEEITYINDIYEKKISNRNSELKVLSTPIKMVGDAILQGQSAEWQSGGMFNYFPINLNKIKVNNLIIDGTKQQIVKSAISSILLHSNIIKTKINNDDLVVTMGSCFASELYVSLTRNNIKCETLRIEESINTTHANLALIESIKNKKLLTSLKELFKNEVIEEKLTSLHELLNRTKILVLTVGVSPVVVDSVTGELLFEKDLKAKFQEKKVEMRFSSVQENSNNLIKIIETLRLISPDIKVFVTLSPVPLIGVPENKSVLERDVVSKSTIRLAIEEAQKHVEFTYWPSFEVVKWISPHIAPSVNFQAFGDPDNNSRHVSRWIVDEITQSFIDHALDISG